MQTARLWMLLMMVPSTLLGQINLLRPVRTETPKETMQTFYEAMNEYREHLNNQPSIANAASKRAVRTFDLDNPMDTFSQEVGLQYAIYLKEVMDRILVIDYQKIPPIKGSQDDLPIRWRLKDTDITIRKKTDGPRAGEYLFTKETLNAAKDAYNLIKDLPYKKGSGQGTGFRKSWISENVPIFLQSDWLGLTAWQWLGLLFAIPLGMIVKHLAMRLMSIPKKIAALSQGQWDDAIVKAIETPAGMAAAAAFWYFFIHLLRIEGNLMLIATTVIQIIFSFAVVLGFYKISDVTAQLVYRAAKKNDKLLDDQLIPLVGRAVKILVVVFGVLIAAQNLGINVFSLVAGLGLGGLAFALAAKDTAANLFGSLMILTDRPFRVGDWIKFNDIEGTVEEIGFRSTRVRTFYNSLATVPNQTVANVTIDNMGKRSYRRVKTYLGVTYDTPPEKLEAFLEGIKNIILANDYSRKDYLHVVFSGYGDSALEIMLYFFLRVPDFSRELLEKQNIFIEILRLARELDVDFAFPTQSVHIETFPEKKGLVRHTQSIDQETLKQRTRDFSRQGQLSKPTGLGIFKAPFLE